MSARDDYPRLGAFLEQWSTTTNRARQLADALDELDRLRAEVLALKAEATNVPGDPERIRREAIGAFLLDFVAANPSLRSVFWPIDAALAAGES